MPSALQPPRQIKLPRHVIDLAADELRSACGDHVELRPRSFAVLRLLAENAGRLVTKDEIIQKVWDDVAVTEDSLTQCVADIRRALGDEERRVLRTVPRKGYTLVAAPSGAPLAGPASDRPSLAVMPFLSIGCEDLLGIGVATEIINELARNRDLRLVARDSSFALAGRNLAAQDIGEQLGVRYLVEGAVQRSAGRLFVDLQLVNARDGSIAWADRESSTAEDVPQIRREIAIKIASTLHSGIRETEIHAVLGAAPRDLDVYGLTLRGLALKHRFHPDATREGRADLEEAIRRDPNYAPAYTYLAWTNLIDMLNRFTGEWPFTRLGEVIEQFRRAIELEPRFAQAYLGLSHALIYTGDVAQSLSAARRGTELGPSDADGMLFLALALFESGELGEAMETVERAVELNPLRPPYYSFFHAKILWGNERYQEALDEIDDCLRKAPNFRADTYRVMALVGLGRIEEAKAQLARSMTRGLVVMPPRPPELASRALSQLQAAGWRPTIAAERAAS